MLSDEKLIFALYLILLLSFVILVSVISFCIVLNNSLKGNPKGATRTLSEMMSRSGALQIITVIIIGISIFLLRMADMISAEVTISALTGISGFVLGGLSEKSRTKEAGTAAQKEADSATKEEDKSAAQKDT